MAGGANSLKSIIYALTANLSIAIAKFAAAFYTGSGAMMAEAIHSVVDSSNQGLLLLGMKRSGRPPSPDYPLGYGKAIFFWSFIVAIMLFTLGGMFSIYEGWHKLHEPEPLQAAWVAVGVLLFGIVAEGLSFAGCVREVNKERGDMSFMRWFRETRKSELLVIFGEDFAALIGLGLALVSILLAVLTGNPAFDALGSMGIGVLLLVVAVFIGVEVKALLIGQGVPPATHAAMLEFLEQQPAVKMVFNLLTYQLGNDVMVVVKAEMARQPGDLELVQAINETEKAFRQEFPEVLWLFFEPDIHD